MSRSMIRRALAAVSVAAGVAATLTVTAGAPASAAGTCSVNIPSRWTISSPYKSIDATLAGNCAPGTQAAWDGFSSQGYEYSLIFDGTRSDLLDVYDDDTLGRWTWRPGDCVSADTTACTQNTRTMDVKVGSWTGLTVTRSGSSVTVTAAAARYSASAGRFVPWAGARGTVQYKAPTATTWTPLKFVNPGSTGRTTFTHTSASPRDYRVIFVDTPVIWGQTSATVRR